MTDGKDKKAKDSKALATADKFIEDMEYPLPSKPINKPEDVEWPKNVADLTSNDLAHHMTWWSGWSSNIRYALARAETNEDAYKEGRRLKLQETIFKSEGDYKTVTEVKAAAEQNEDIKRIDGELLKIKAIRRLLKSLLEGYEEKYAVVSREISRRQREEYEERRK